MSRRSWIASIASYFACVRTALGISSAPPPARLRAVREAVEVYEREKEAAGVFSERDDRYDHVVDVRRELIDAIRALRPGKPVKPEDDDGSGMDLVHWDCVLVDGTLYSVT
jgi:hypothetical protein